MKCGATSKVKFLKLKRRLGLAHWQTVGVLESLWLFTQQNAPRGDVGRYSNEDIAAGIEWAGDPDALILALVECSWLDECADNRLVVHGWEEHAPTYLKGAIAKHNQQFAKQSAKHVAKQDEQDAAKQLAPQPASKPSLFKPIQAKPIQATSESSEPSETGRSEPPVMTFPTVGEDPPKDWPLEDAKLAQWKIAFPGVDVIAELRKARQWLLDNPTRRKTQRGIARFLGAWLSRVQDRTSNPSTNGTHSKLSQRERILAMGQTPPEQTS